MARSASATTVASARIAAALRTDILGGVLAPGTRIRQEDLAGRFAASRIPVREALRILESEGLVTLVANSGAWVAALSEEECSEVYRIRERLEPLLLAMSIPALSYQQIDRLGELATTMASGVSVEDFLRLDREFHLLSYAGASSEILAGMIHRLWNSTQHYRRSFTQMVGVGGLGATHLEHSLLVDAVRRRDAPDAGRVLHSHIRRTRKALLNHPDVFDAITADGQGRRRDHPDPLAQL